jgi:hypothetical protein
MNKIRRFFNNTNCWVLAQFTEFRHAELVSASNSVVFRPRNKPALERYSPWFGVTMKIEIEPVRIGDIRGINVQQSVLSSTSSPQSVVDYHKLPLRIMASFAVKKVLESLQEVHSDTIPALTSSFSCDAQGARSTTE